jgi:hypothetical protein
MPSAEFEPAIPAMKRPHGHRDRLSNALVPPRHKSYHVLGAVMSIEVKQGTGKAFGPHSLNTESDRDGRRIISREAQLI